jgi:hypothetical protein
MSAGIIIMENGKIIGEDRPRYDSRRPRWQVNLKANPAHLAVLRFTGGTAFVGSAGVVSQQEETLLEIEHKLPYTPDVLAYFYAQSYAGSEIDPKAQRYAADTFIYSGSAGTVADNLFIRVSATSLKVVHQLDNFNGIAYTSDANQYVIRFKYYILSNDCGLSSYHTRGY